MKRYLDSIIADLLRRFNLNPSNNMGTNNLNFINEYRYKLVSKDNMISLLNND